jgi:hypothetical protein
MIIQKFIYIYYYLAVNMGLEWKRFLDNFEENPKGVFPCHGNNTHVILTDQYAIKETDTGLNILLADLQRFLNSGVRTAFRGLSRNSNGEGYVVVQKNVEYTHEDALEQDAEAFLDSIDGTIRRAATYEIVLDSRIENFGIDDFSKEAIYFDIQEPKSTLDEYASNPYKFMKNRLAVSLRQEDYSEHAEKVSQW